MLTRDPFKPAPRHARPRRTARRTIAVIGAAVAAGGALTLAGHAYAATGPVTSGFGATVARDATRAAGRFTPSPAPMTHGYGPQERSGQPGTVRGVFRR